VKKKKRQRKNNKLSNVHLAGEIDLTTDLKDGA